MAKSTFLSFSTTAGDNTDIDGIGTQGTNAVSNFDNAFRTLMAILRRDLDNGTVFVTRSTGYTAVAGDNNAFYEFTATATLALTAAATLAADWHMMVFANGGVVTVDPDASEQINGAATLTIANGDAAYIICTGTAFKAVTIPSAASVALKADLLQAYVDVASATTTDIGAAASQSVRITGTTTITGLGTVAAGTFRRIRFSGALTLTHNGTSLILPGAANILTAANDTIMALSLGSGNWFCFGYQGAGGIVTPWVAYTPTFTGFGTVSGVSIWSRRVGDTLKIRGKFISGTATSTEGRMTLGYNGVDGGITSDGTKVPSLQLAGTAIISLTTAISAYTLIEGGVGYITFSYQASGQSALTKLTGAAFGNSTTFSLVADIPISGW